MRRLGCEFGLEIRLGLHSAEFTAITKLVPDVEFVDASAILWRLRMTKSVEEVARMQKACEITTAAR